MKRPRTSTMLIGHPFVAIPLILVCAISMVAGVVTRNGGEALFILPIIMAVLNVSQQASAYRAWKAEWDAMGDEPPRRSISLRRILGSLLLLVMPFAAYAMRFKLASGVGYAVGWLTVTPWAMAGLGLLVLVQVLRFICRCRPRKASRNLVTVIAKPALPVPTTVDAYRALPPYCHDLLRRQS